MHTAPLAFGIVFSLVMAACSAPDSNIDSASEKLWPTVTAFAQTEPVPDFDDAADDPYVMVTAAGEVIIAGTNKRRGVELYDLQGRKLAALDSGRVNNVDGVFDSATNAFRIAGSNRTSVQVCLLYTSPSPRDS